MTLLKARSRRDRASRNTLTSEHGLRSRHEAQARTPSNFEDDRSVELVAARERQKLTGERERGIAYGEYRSALILSHGRETAAIPAETPTIFVRACNTTFGASSHVKHGHGR